MRKSSKLLFAGLTAAIVLSMAVASASANRLVVNEKSYRIVWSPLRFIAGGNTVSCNVTLEGSFHSATIRKVERALIGHVTRASVNTCTGGSATVLNATLPWHVQYNGFTGTLPRITGVLLKLVGASFQVQPSGSLACLAATTEERPAKGIAGVEAGTVTELTAEAAAEIPLRGGGGLCAFAGGGHFEGTGTVTKLGGGSLTIKLI
jgi:hypothetical protein